MSNDVVLKRLWQRRHRAEFRDKHGYSESASYATGKLREAVLTRDEWCCVRCGMTDAGHKTKWNRPITIDHIDKNRKNNTLANLQTLCLTCHGRKDLIPRLRVQRVPNHKADILSRRERGEPYQTIADALGFSVAAIWKWCKQWETTNE